MRFTEQGVCFPSFNVNIYSIKPNYDIYAQAIAFFFFNQHTNAHSRQRASEIRTF